jgi:YYY domain-containing protein
LNLILTKLSELGVSSFRSTIPGLQDLVAVARGLILVIRGAPMRMNVEWWYWTASRIMTNGEINEFPFFTFLYSDLHAHMIAFPLTLLMLGIAAGWAARRTWHTADAVVSVVVGALVVGAARANNTWDYPTYLALALVAVFVSGLTRRSGAAGHPAHVFVSLGAMVGLFGAAWALGGINDLPTFLSLAALVAVVGQLLHRLADGEGVSQWRWIDLAYIGVLGLSILYFYPYIQQYATAYSSVDVWRGARTPAQAYILIHGILLFPVLAFLVVELRRMGLRWFVAAVRVSGAWLEVILAAALVGLAATALLVYFKYQVIFIVAPLVALALLALLQRHAGAGRRFVLLGVLMALALTFAVEVIVLKGDIGRMNTVFKFYLQVWLILGVAAAVMVGWLARQMRRWPDDLRDALWLCLGALVAAGLLYPILATRAKINDRFDVRLGPTLDAMDFMLLASANEQGQVYALRAEYDALIWMQDHIQGTPVVAESAAAPEYRSLRNRVTTYTGLPALVGYNWHQKQQRSILPPDTVDRRQADANQIFTTTDANVAWSLIAKYNVGYVIVGYPERLYYPSAGLAKFDQMVSEGRLRVAYKNPGVTLYQVTKDK